MSTAARLDVSDVVRLSVPWSARVETLSLSEQDLDIVEITFANLRRDGFHYVAVAAPHDAVRPDGFRLVIHEPGVCAVFALSSVAEPRDGVASDGIPFPPPEMVRLTAGISTSHRFYQRFMEGGAREADRMREMLARNGLALESCPSVFDFGCGCGRVMRRWKDLSGTRLHGSDYNPYLIEWCRQNLAFAEFSVNGLDPGLEAADGAFDLVYSYSVFTHLPEPMQRPWLEELARVTAPGGHLMLTFHGENTLSDLTGDERARFAAGELVVVARDEGDYGTNACAAYHPEAWVRETLAAGLEVIDRWPGDDSFKQDAYLIGTPPPR